MTRDIATALAQLADAKASLGVLPLSPWARKRGLHEPTRTMRRAILESALDRAVRHLHTSGVC